jgi:hypothetical protein
MSGTKSLTPVTVVKDGPRVETPKSSPTTAGIVETPPSVPTRTTLAAEEDHPSPPRVQEFEVVCVGLNNLTVPVTTTNFVHLGYLLSSTPFAQGLSVQKFADSLAPDVLAEHYFRVPSGEFCGDFFSFEVIRSHLLEFIASHEGYGQLLAFVSVSILPLCFNHSPVVRARRDASLQVAKARIFSEMVAIVTSTLQLGTLPVTLQTVFPIVRAFANDIAKRNQSLPRLMERVSGISDDGYVQYVFTAVLGWAFELPLPFIHVASVLNFATHVVDISRSTNPLPGLELSSALLKQHVALRFAEQFAIFGALEFMRC